MALNFPEDAHASRPYVFFQCTARNIEVIALPIPGSLQFSDGATYNNTELGFLGGSLGNIASTVSSQGLSGESVKNAIAGQVTKVTGEYEKAGNIGTLVQGITAMTGANEGLQSAISIGTGTTVNKNITTEFTSTNTRVFSFQFQLIPRSKKESTTIKNIVKTFREGLYPEAIGFQLKYPPKWKIRFPQNSHLPKIGETYLTEVNTTYNGSTNMWRDDGTPLETTIQVSFMETKAYTYNTIKSL